MNNKTNNKITLDNGYTMESTFVMDFSIADIFGLSAVKDTYKIAKELVTLTTVES